MHTTKKVPSIREAEAEFRPVSVSLRLLFTFGPLALFGILFVVTFVAAGWHTFRHMLSLVIGSFVGLGKFVVFAGVSPNAPLSSYAIAALVVLGDFATALILLFNMHLLFKIPKLGGHLCQVQLSGHDVLHRHKWIHTISWLGLAIFVAVPFQGTGSVLGVFIGRILGMRRREIVASIMTGASVGSFGLAALAGILSKTQQDHIQYIAEHPLWVAGIIGGVVLLSMVLGRWFLGTAQREEAKKAEPGQSP
ncbi:MAG: small multi-drug export protein [Proteobacteria bacterium]|nr:small multi-drug export protein [Pseudomonadota bacterium]